MDSYLDALDQMNPDQRLPAALRWISEEPLPFFDELRVRQPILRLPEVTLVALAVDVEEILRRYDLFSVALYQPKQGTYFMAQDDTAQHWREKSIMSSVLDFEELPQIRAYVADKTKSLLAAAKGELDAVNGLTRLVPISLVQDWFGFVDSNPDDLRQWSYWNQMDAFWNQSFQHAANADAIVANREAANVAMAKYIVGLVQRRAGELKAGAKLHDPVSRLIILANSGALLFPPERLVLNIGGLLIGAVETTSHAVVNALDFFLKNRGLLAEARDAAASQDTARFDGYVNEALRFKPPFPYFFRKVEAPTVLARETDYEEPLAAGDIVLPLGLSAMFDEAAYDDPEDFIPGRSQSNCFLYGHGLHECLGRAIGAVMIPEMVRQALLLPGLEAGEVDRKGGPVPESWSWRWTA